MVAPTVWITGASGLLGSHLAATAPRPWEVVGLRRSRSLPATLAALVSAELSLDLGDADAVARNASRTPPDLVIHSAGRTLPLECEANPAAAELDNVVATRVLVGLCARLGCPLVHCSTDLVFDGHAAPYRETDHRRPVGVYAVTKAAAEDLVLTHSLGLVIRLPLMLGRSPSGQRSVDEGLRRMVEAGHRVRLFTDELRTPIHATLAARLIWRLVEVGARGVVHLAGRTRVSRWQLGVAVAQRLGLPLTALEQARLADYGGLPPRCPDVSLDTARLTALVGHEAPSFAQSLALPLAGEEAGDDGRMPPGQEPRSLP